MADQGEGQCKRAHDRRKMMVPVDIGEMDDAGELTAVTPGKLADMSQGGIGIMTAKLLYVDSKIVIRMKSKTGYITYGAIVRSSRYDTKHGHFSGCAWLAKTERIPTANKIEQYIQRHRAA